ncbi:MAG: tetratricopeptide repeat protein [Syntrophorhabdaceae bacterium]
MARKKDKEILHHPDIFMRSYDYVSLYIQENTKQVIYGLIAILLIAAGVASYFIYANYQDKKVQYQLAQGIQAMETYGQTKAQTDIAKAQDIFQKIASQTQGNPRYISTLYLANISLIQGKRDEALKQYQDVARNSSNDILIQLANTALKSVEKK